MLKSTEMIVPTSCWNKARANEQLFILLARDPAAPSTILHWIGERLRLGLNVPSDEQIISAEQAAFQMMQESINKKAK